MNLKNRPNTLKVKIYLDNFFKLFRDTIIINQKFLFYLKFRHLEVKKFQNFFICLNNKIKKILINKKNFYGKKVLN